MIIKSILGKTIYQSNQRTIRAAIEEGVSKNIDFSYADLRRGKFSRASLDGLIARKANFWGADLDGADIGLADLRKADLRCSNLKDTCFAEASLSGADLRGAYFSNTIIEGTILDDIYASCPSFWDLDFKSAASFKNAIFCHLGEHNIRLQEIPLVLEGQNPRLVIHGHQCIWSGGLYGGGPMPAQLERTLTGFKFTLEKLLKQDISHNAMKPIPKILSQR